MRQRFIYAMLYSLSISACSTYDRAAMTTFRPEPGGFEYTAFTDNFYRDDSAGAEKDRMAWLEEYLRATTGSAPAVTGSPTGRAWCWPAARSCTTVQGFTIKAAAYSPAGHAQAAKVTYDASSVARSSMVSRPVMKADRSIFHEPR